MMFALAAVLPAGAQSLPKIVSVTPALGVTNAAPRGVVVFEFDQEMDITTPPMTGVPNVLVGNFEFEPASVKSLMSGSWGSNRRTLKFQPNGPIPLKTTVVWTLNPAGAKTPLKSVTGQPLETATGSFAIAPDSGGNPAETCPPATPAPGAYTFSKNVQYVQTSAEDPVQAAGNPGLFAISVQSPPAGPAVTAGSITFPNGASKPLLFQVGVFRMFESYANEAALETARPAGDYTLRFTQTGESERVIPIPLPATPSIVPKLANYAEAQAIDATKDFTLQWNAFSPAPAGAIVRVVISDEFANRVFLAPNSCVPRTLDPTATSVVIPANYLRPGFRYQGQVIFASNFYSSKTDVPQMTGNFNVQRSTLFTFQTAPDTNGIVNEVCTPTTTPSTGAFTITKLLQHRQTSADEVIPHTPGHAIFSAALQSPPSGPAVIDASFTRPDGTRQTYLNQAGTYSHSATYPTETEIDAMYPAGSYTVRFMQAGQPERDVAMSMPAMPGSIPRIVNYAEAQAIDASQDFALKWNPLTPQVPGAFIRLIITDDRGNLVFLAPNPCVPRTLDAAATSIVVPAKYFGPGLTYRGQLQFGLEFYSASSEVQMYGYGSVQRSTSFDLKAAGGGGSGTVVPATFTQFRALESGHPEFHLSGTAGKTYSIQRAAHLAGAAWSPKGSVTMDASGKGTFQDTDAASNSSGFYRAVAD